VRKVFFTISLDLFPDNFVILFYVTAAVSVPLSHLAISNGRVHFIGILHISFQFLSQMAGISLDKTFYWWSKYLRRA
jgi:hypothetical protein